MADAPIIDSELSLPYLEFRTANGDANITEGRDPAAQGVYSSFSLMAPKYLRRIVGRHHEFEGTTARMLLQIPSGTYAKLQDELTDDATKQIFAVLAGDGSYGGGYGYIDFILSQANHNLEEKVQVSETLSDNYTSFFFGHKPPLFQYAGFLMNTFQDDWTMQMLRLFRELGRGTALARRGLLMHLKYDSMIVSGAMLDFKWLHNGQTEAADSFSFGFLVKKINIIYGGVGRVTALDFISTEMLDDLKFAPNKMTLGDIESTHSYVQVPATDKAATNMPKGVKKTLRAKPKKEDKPLAPDYTYVPFEDRYAENYYLNGYPPIQT